MSPVQQKPILHGRDHCPGGADPIPCLGSSGFSSHRECVLANSALVAYYPMDEASGDLADLAGGPDATRVNVHDSITYGLDGPFADEFPTRTSISNEGGAGFGGALHQDRFDIPGGGPFGGTSSWTIESWAYPTSVAVNEDNYLFINHASGGNVGVGAYLDPMGGELHAFRNSVAVISDPVPNDQWVHWRLSYDGTELRLYLNGALVDSAADTNSLTGFQGVASIMNQSFDYTSYKAPFNGRMSDFAIYDDAVTDFCGTVTETGPGSGTSIEGTVLSADGAGGSSWAYPTLEVEFT